MILGLGVLRAHLFENEPMGCPRRIYWGLNISELQSKAPSAGEIESINCDWLTFPVRRASQLSNLSLGDCLYPNLVECSIYYDAEHHLVTLDRFAFATSAARGELTALVALHPSTEPIAGPLEIECSLRFEGLIVVPQSFEPPPRTAEDVAILAAPHVDLEEFEPPVWDRFRYLLKPKPSSFPLS